MAEVETVGWTLDPQDAIGLEQVGSQVAQIGNHLEACGRGGNVRDSRVLTVVLHMKDGHIGSIDEGSRMSGNEVLVAGLLKVAN